MRQWFGSLWIGCRSSNTSNSRNLELREVSQGGNGSATIALFTTTPPRRKKDLRSVDVTNSGIGIGNGNDHHMQNAWSFPHAVEYLFRVNSRAHRSDIAPLLGSVAARPIGQSVKIFVIKLIPQFCSLTCGRIVES